MLHSLHSMIGYKIHATDGSLGKVDDFYFDDTDWTVRYLVAHTGHWFSSRRVLISLAAVKPPDFHFEQFLANLTCEQVKKSPDIDTDSLVTREHEANLHEHYQWNTYWGNVYNATMGMAQMLYHDNHPENERTTEEQKNAMHLHSINRTTGFHILAGSNDLGHVSDFLITVETWEIINLVVDKGHFFPGKMEVVPRSAIKNVNWSDARMMVDPQFEAVDFPGKSEAGKDLHW